MNGFERFGALTISCQISLYPSELTIHSVQSAITKQSTYLKPHFGIDFEGSKFFSQPENPFKMSVLNCFSRKNTLGRIIAMLIFFISGSIFSFRCAAKL